MRARLVTLADWERSGRRIRWKQHEIFVREGGAGPSVLLIHGFPTSSWDWHSLWSPLAECFHVIAFDMLGFGFSSKPRGHAYFLVEQADLAEFVASELGITETELLAHDYGDSVAQELLARFVEGGERTKLKLRGVTFLNGGLFPETHRPLLVQKLLASPLGALAGALTLKPLFARNLKATFAPNSQIADEEIDALWEACTRDGGRFVLHKLIGYMRERREHRDRWVSAMQSSKVPLSLIVGEADPISGAHMAARYRELVPHSPVTSLAGVGHYPQLEAPRQVLEALRERVRGLILPG